MTEVDVSFKNDTGRPCYIKVWNSGWSASIIHAGVSNGHSVFFSLKPDWVGPTMFSGGEGFNLSAPLLLFGGADGKAGLGDVEEEDLPIDERAGKIQNKSGLRRYLLVKGKSNDYIDQMIKDIKVRKSLQNFSVSHVD